MVRNSLAEHARGVGGGNDNPDWFFAPVALQRLAEPRQVVEECFGCVGRLVSKEDNRTGDASLALAK